MGFYGTGNYAACDGDFAKSKQQVSIITMDTPDDQAVLTVRLWGKDIPPFFVRVGSSEFPLHYYKSSVATRTRAKTLLSRFIAGVSKELSFEATLDRPSDYRGLGTTIDKRYV